MLTQNPAYSRLAIRKHKPDLKTVSQPQCDTQNREDPAPVGHGGFHTGHITTTEVSGAKSNSSAGPPTGAFSYVYDQSRAKPSKQNWRYSASGLVEGPASCSSPIFTPIILTELIGYRGWRPLERPSCHLDEIERLLFVLRL